MPLILADLLTKQTIMLRSGILKVDLAPTAVLAVVEDKLMI